MADPVFFNRMRILLSTLVSSMRDDKEMTPIVEKLKETLLALDTLMQQHSGGEEALKAYQISQVPINERDKLKGIRPGYEEKKSEESIRKRKVKKEKEKKRDPEAEEDDET